jgi:hypothetical protein
MPKASSVSLACGGEQDQSSSGIAALVTMVEEVFLE